MYDCHMGHIYDNMEISNIYFIWIQSIRYICWTSSELSPQLQKKIKHIKSKHEKKIINKQLFMCYLMNLLIYTQYSDCLSKICKREHNVLNHNVI